jgi:hypothetical protein
MYASEVTSKWCSTGAPVEQALTFCSRVRLTPYKQHATAHLQRLTVLEYLSSLLPGHEAPYAVFYSTVLFVKLINPPATGA